MTRVLAVVDRWFEDSPGGMARVAKDHARALHRHGWNVTVATLAPPGQEASVVDADGIRLVRLGVPDATSGMSRLLVFRRSLRRALGDESWDLVHLHSAPLGRAALGVVPRETSVVVTVHSPVTDEMRINWSTRRVRAIRQWIGSYVLKKMEGQVLSRAAVVHTLSDYTKKRMAELHGPVGIEVVPHWVPEMGAEVDSIDVDEIRSELGWPANKPVLFTVRGHKPRVGLEDVIDAAAPLLRIGACHLVIAGGGPLSGQLRERAGRLGVGSAISFPGRIADEQLEMSYRAADLFVLPTRQLECFGLVTIEALSRGLPVLASDAGATPEVLGSIAPDFLYPAGDVGALRSRLESFLDGSLESPPSQTLKVAVRGQYGEATVVPRLVQMFERAIHGVPSGV